MRRSAAAAEEQKAFLLRENAEHERAINELLSKAGSVSAENAQLKQEIASDYDVIGVVTASLSSSDEV